MNVQTKPADKFDTDTADNAETTSTLAAPVGGQANYVTHVAASFDTASVGPKTLALKEGSTTLLSWEFQDTLVINFPNPIKVNGAANAVLDASGTGGQSGTTSIAGYEA